MAIRPLGPPTIPSRICLQPLHNLWVFFGKYPMISGSLCRSFGCRPIRCNMSLTFFFTKHEFYICIGNNTCHGTQCELSCIFLLKARNTCRSYMYSNIEYASRYMWKIPQCAENCGAASFTSVAALSQGPGGPGDQAPADHKMMAFHGDMPTP